MNTLLELRQGCLWGNLSWFYSFIYFNNPVGIATGLFMGELYWLYSFILLNNPVRIATELFMGEPFFIIERKRGEWFLFIIDLVV